MYSERTRLRLGDIVENADRIASYIDGIPRDRFKDEQMTADAVERCIERITEAIVQIGEAEFAELGFDVAFHEARGLGNRLRHEYRRIDHRIIFDTAIAEIPPLRAAAAAALDAHAD